MCISGDASRGQTARLRPVRQSPFPGPQPRSRSSPSRALWLPCVQSVSSVFHSCVSPHHPAWVGCTMATSRMAPWGQPGARLAGQGEEALL